MVNRRREKLQGGGGETLYRTDTSSSGCTDQPQKTRSLKKEDAIDRVGQYFFTQALSVNPPHHQLPRFYPAGKGGRWQID
ncbi:hypothetical protein [Desulfobacca acetoxidans]